MNTIVAQEGVLRSWSLKPSLALAVGAALLATEACACGSTGGDTRRQTVVELDLRRLPEEKGSLGALREGRAHIGAWLRSMRSMVDNQQLQGVLVRLGSVGGDWARAQEVTTALRRLNSKKRQVFCHMTSTDGYGLALAAQSCDRVVASTGAMIDLVGVKFEMVFLHKLLKRVGIDAELMQVGRFKGAADPLTEATMSADLRASLEALVQARFETLVRALATGRKLDRQAVLALVDRGPLSAQEALRGGLIDARGTLRSTREQLLDKVGVRRFAKQGQAGLGLAELFRSDDAEAHAGHDRIVFATVEGPIYDDGPAASSSWAGSEAFVEAMHRAADDRHVKAVVLRINSPGGSALASDRMWLAVRRVSQRKPVVATLGDIAASGGYYVASAAREIFAAESSLVGSIGVVGGKIAVASLGDRIGVHFEAAARGRHARWTSPGRRLSTSERQRLRELLEQTYALFLRRVAEGRNQSVEALASYVEGRLLSGEQAALGPLVDRVGGLEDAFDEACKLAKLTDRCAVQSWPSSPPLGRVLEELISPLANAPNSDFEQAAKLLPSELQSFTPLLQTYRGLWQAPGTALALAPYLWMRTSGT